MAGTYGSSFAKKLVEQGEYEEAVAAATREIDSGAFGPELLVDRATAYEMLERFDEAAADFEQAIVVDRHSRVLEIDLVDDAYFGALLEAAKNEARSSVDAAVRRLDRYPGTLPKGAHLRDVEDWKKRFRGELVSTLDKTVDM